MITKFDCVLPDRPSDLIELAMADLALCEADPEYEIEMAEWHCPLVSGRCQVCLAGAVMAKTCDMPIDRYGSPMKMGAETAMKLYALDSFRVGDVFTGLSYMGRETTKEFDRSVTHYDSFPERFKREMSVLADDLERGGL